MLNKLCKIVEFSAQYKTLFILGLLLFISSCGNNNMMQDTSQSSRPNIFANIFQDNSLDKYDKYNENGNISKDFYGFDKSSYLLENEDIKIAILLPLSGQKSSIGKHILNAAELALFDNATFQNKAKISIMPFDTKGNEEGAVNAFNNAVRQDASVILGPVFSDNTRAILPYSMRSNINVISFSNDASLLHNGIYLIGFMPEDQINRILNFARMEGHQNFTALLPRNEYGMLSHNIYRQNLNQNGLDDSRIFWYLKEGGDISETLSNIIRESNSPSFSNLGNSNRNILFIPEGGRNLLSIHKRLKQQKALDKFHIIGTGSWDDEYITSNSSLRGSLFSSSPINTRHFFEANFKELFDYQPIRVASLGYDAVALVAAIAREGLKLDKASIESSSGFAGVNGTFRFLPSGKNQRLLSVMQITDEEPIEISAPLANF